MLPSVQKRLARKSWACLGADTSMSSIAVVGIGYDAKLDKIVGPFYADMRWTVEDYWTRLAQAARGETLIQEVVRKLWVLDPDKVQIAVEEPFPMGMLRRAKWEASYVKQQCEVAGAFKGGLVRAGYRNLWEINNAQWKATLRREGVTIRKMDEGGKWDVKDWAVQAFGLPVLPDLVKGKSGGKIPRPESGFGAKAKAVQPNDIYDAAAVCAWMLDEAEKQGLV